MPLKCAAFVSFCVEFACMDFLQALWFPPSSKTWILQRVLMTKARVMIWSWSAGTVAAHCIHQDGFNASSSSSSSSCFVTASLFMLIDTVMYTHIRFSVWGLSSDTSPFHVSKKSRMAWKVLTLSTKAAGYPQCYRVFMQIYSKTWQRLSLSTCGFISLCQNRCSLSFLWSPALF